MRQRRHPRKPGGRGSVRSVGTPAPPTVRSFSGIRNLRVVPRPEPGRSRQLWISWGPIRVKACKDTGSSGTTIPESLVLRVINHYAGMDPDLEGYPVGELLEYQPPINLRGFASSTSMKVKYGCILLTTFEDVDGTTRSAPIEFRVVPDTGAGNGCPSLGARTVGPEGLDICTDLRHHVIRRLSLSCRRAEFEVHEVGTAGGSPSLAGEEPQVRATRTFTPHAVIGSDASGSVAVPIGPAELCRGASELVATSTPVEGLILSP